MFRSAKEAKNVNIEVKYNNIIDIIKSLEKDLRSSSFTTKEVDISLPNDYRVTQVSLTNRCVIITIYNKRTDKTIAHKIHHPYSIYPINQNDILKIKHGLKRVFNELGIIEEDVKPKDREEAGVYEYYYDGRENTVQYYNYYGRYTLQREEINYNKKLSSALSKARTYDEFIRAITNHSSEEETTTDIRAEILE